MTRSKKHPYQARPAACELIPSVPTWKQQIARMEQVSFDSSLQRLLKAVSRDLYRPEVLNPIALVSIVRLTVPLTSCRSLKTMA